MKIKLFGTGSLSSQSLSASALIDNTILFDCPNGLVKTLRRDNVDFNRIRAVIISHFHADHDWDLPFLLFEYIRVSRKHPLAIVAPRGFTDRHKTLCDMSWPGAFSWDSVVRNMPLEIHEAADRETFHMDGYAIQAYRMSHGDCDAYGYRISKDGKTAAFTGDSTMCDNMVDLVDGADVAFVDVTGPPPAGFAPMHLDVGDFQRLQGKTQTRLVPVHTNDDVRDQLEELGLRPPADGNEVVV